MKYKKGAQMKYRNCLFRTFQNLICNTSNCCDVCESRVIVEKSQKTLFTVKTVKHWHTLKRWEICFFNVLAQQLAWKLLKTCLRPKPCFLKQFETCTSPQKPRKLNRTVKKIEATSVEQIWSWNVWNPWRSFQNLEVCFWHFLKLLTRFWQKYRLLSSSQVLRAL